MYLLADNAQDARYVQSGEGLPLNRTMLNTYVNVNSAFSGLQDSLSKFIFPGENQKKADTLIENLLQ